MLDRLYVEGTGIADANLDFAFLVKQIAHRYPRMKVIEVGAGTGGTTRAVLSSLGDQYASYTYTDISAGFFEPAKAKFSQHGGKLKFKTLNIEKDPMDQGYDEGSFDMVIASNCLHATRSLQETLRHCRRLLRPGGYLVLLEITRDHLPMQLIMGTLPGWFLGADEGRVWAPTISRDEWDALLKANIFSGVTASSTPSYCSVIMSRAVDDTFQLLQAPLSDVSHQLLGSRGPVLVVGGNKSGLGAKSQEILASHGASYLRELEGIEVPSGAVVLCLSDLDSPIFGVMTEAIFQGIQTIFRNASIVLWVTSGATSGKTPMANLTVGLGRTLLAECSDLRLQFLDAEEPESLTPELLATLLLRLGATDLSNSDDILRTHEPHLALRDGAFYIPKVQRLDSLNQRASAKNRKPTQITSLELADTSIEVSAQDGALELFRCHVGDCMPTETRVQVTALSIHSFTCDGLATSDIFGSVYFWIGRDVNSGDKIVGFSDSNRSIATVTKDQILYRGHDAAEQDKQKLDADQLYRLIVQAMASSLLGNLEAPVWVHGAPGYVRQAISHVAREAGISAFLTTSNISSARDDGFIHPYISKRDLQSFVPRPVKTLINLEAAQNKDLSTLMRECLPSYTTTIEVDDLMIAIKYEKLRDLAQVMNKNNIKSADHLDQIIPIGDLTEEKLKVLNPGSVIDWRTTERVTTTVRALDQSGLFEAEKTYILFGMTGDVGISVAAWMVEHGARNVVLGSRNPRVPEGVIEYMSQKGAHLSAAKVDVTKKEELREACAHIKATMPPIGVVINGAMVLRDRLFAHMSWDDFEAVLAPKVVGTQNLDEVFSEMDDALDFFIVLSSATSLVGIIGQSAYSAANHFMSSLVRQRHSRGLAGSVVAVGFLTDLGYIFRSEKEHLDAIERSLLPQLGRQAETDLHDMLAEAIVCGRPNSGQPSELITAIKTIFPDAWHEDPRLSCYLVQDSVQDGTDAKEVEGNAKVEAQPAAAEDPKLCLTILVKCFTVALGNMLQLDPAQIAVDVPVVDHGVDSLVSVRIRDWFLKELGVDVPVLKLMSTNHSLLRVCEDALAGWRKLRAGPPTGSQAEVKDSEPRRDPEKDWTKEMAELIGGLRGLIPRGTDSTAIAEPLRANARRVVVTGCTGFLGTHLLRHLVADASVAEVHCLCIRSCHVRVQDAKIREYMGDLAKPLLGLSASDFKRLSQTADVIIHLGADVNHLKSYEAMRTANVISTQILLAMAMSRNVPVHYISSSSVAMLQKGTSELAEVPPSSISPPGDVESLMKSAVGYAASKWVGEMLLENVEGPPTVVHRFPNIMGPDAPEEIPLVALDRYCIKMRAVPALDPRQWIGQLDVIDVRQVVPDFVEMAWNLDPCKSFAVHNYCSNNSYQLSDLAGMYKEKLGADIEVLPTSEWMRRAIAMGMPKGVEATVVGHNEVFVSPVLRKGLGKR
jgi:nucleoside-diphosphate-sugar epimerase/SAM-dependent methyltransferase